MDSTDGSIFVSGAFLSERLYSTDHPAAAGVEPNRLAETEIRRSRRKSDRTEGLKVI